MKFPLFIVRVILFIVFLFSTANSIHNLFGLESLISSAASPQPFLKLVVVTTKKMVEFFPSYQFDNLEPVQHVYSGPNPNFNPGRVRVTFVQYHPTAAALHAAAATTPPGHPVVVPALAFFPLLFNYSLQFGAQVVWHLLN